MRYAFVRPCAHGVRFTYLTCFNILQPHPSPTSSPSPVSSYSFSLLPPPPPPLNIKLETKKSIACKMCIEYAIHQLSIFIRVLSCARALVRRGLGWKYVHCVFHFHLSFPSSSRASARRTQGTRFKIRALRLTHLRLRIKCEACARGSTTFHAFLVLPRVHALAKECKAARLIFIQPCVLLSCALCEHFGN